LIEPTTSRCAPKSGKPVMQIRLAEHLFAAEK